MRNLAPEYIYHYPQYFSQENDPPKKSPKHFLTLHWFQKILEPFSLDIKDYITPNYNEEIFNKVLLSDDRETIENKKLKGNIRGEIFNRRIKRLYDLATEEKMSPPHAESKELMMEFLGLFHIPRPPELTLSDNSCFCFRYTNQDKTLILIFLKDRDVHYLIDTEKGHCESIEKMSFFLEVYTPFIERSVFNG